MDSPARSPRAGQPRKTERPAALPREATYHPPATWRAGCEAPRLASILLERQADVVFSNGGPRRERARDILKLGLLHAALERRVRFEAVQERGHVVGITHALPDPLETDIGIAVEPFGCAGAKELDQRARQHAHVGHGEIETLGA